MTWSQLCPDLWDLRKVVTTSTLRKIFRSNRSRDSAQAVPGGAQGLQSGGLERGAGEHGLGLGLRLGAASRAAGLWRSRRPRGVCCVLLQR